MTKSFLFTFAVALFLTALPSMAAIDGPYTTTTPIALTSTDWTNTLSFQKFDSSMGSLISVQLDLNASMSTVLAVSSTSNATGWAKTEVAMEIQDAGSNLVLTPIDMLSPAFNFSNLNGSVTSGTLTKSGSSSEIYTSAAVLNAFTGTGNILLNAGTLTTTLLSFTSGNATADQVTNASLTGTVTYTYDPIPEPATITLLAIGALALLKRKNSK